MTALLLAIEGADGAGKATTAAEVARQLGAAGKRAEVVAFPRYADTIGGHVLGDFLGGRLARQGSPEAIAVLYALDRLESAAHIRDVAARNDVVVFDRYIASNMAYQGAKVPAGAAEALMRWIVALETGQFGLPAPDLSVYLDTPLDTARAQVARKQQRAYTDLIYDQHEADAALQAAVRANYAILAASDLIGDWITVRPLAAEGTMRPPADIAAEIVGAAMQRIA